jgi:acyl transferase domain-containing protein
MPSSTTHPPDGIAIVGLSGRFPGAPDVRTFWQNLCAGRESVKVWTDEELLASGATPEMLREPAFVRARGVLEGAEGFDARFFGFQPRDADLADPQQRVFLECSWEALENAGYDPGRFSGSIGVFAGASLNTYFLAQVLRSADGIQQFTQGFQVDHYPTLIGSDKDYLATRVAFKLNLRGPAVTVQSACSTSLVAVSQACASLLAYQCDMALAGGVSISFPQARGYLYQEGAIASADGHCRAFDADANGTVFGAGCGVVVLKRADEAVRDGDTIYAVIRATALNNDGSGKASYSAPSLDGQAEVIALSHALAGISADTISYVEAHGTGTPLGDPIEVSALTLAFRASTDRSGFCGLGSVKTNIGHLEAAAGVTGLIKTALALRHRLLPATLHFKRPNPNIDFAGSPFRVIRELTPWNDCPEPRRAGVSSFGVGGTNAHAVLEEAPPAVAREVGRPEVLLVLSARTPNALACSARHLAAALMDVPADGSDSQAWLADAAYTLQVGRARFDHRWSVAVESREAARAALEKKANADPVEAPAIVSGRVPSVVFLFPGQGAQQVNMGRGWYDAEPRFREVVDACNEELRLPLGLDLTGLVYPPAGREDEAAVQLNETRWAQPALFVVEYALARLFQHWGVQPAAVCGHSVGEYVAAVLAGVMTLPEALARVAARGRLMQEAPRGGMLAVRVGGEALEGLLPEGVSIAAYNSPKSCVVAGTQSALKALQETLESQGVAARPLPTSHAFHSAMMDGVLEPFGREVRRGTLRSAQLPIVSTMTGRWIASADWADPEYWTRQIRKPVRFSEAVQSLTETPGRILLEVGPGQALMNLAQQHSDGGRDFRVVATLPTSAGMAGRTGVLGALGQLWNAGVEPDWAALHEGSTLRRVPLPTYPFERQRHWIGPEPGGSARVRAGSVSESGQQAGGELEGALNRTMDPEEVILQQLELMSAQLEALGRWGGRGAVGNVNVNGNEAQ